MRNWIFVIVIFCCLLSALPFSANGANDSLYFLYQRSTYLENLQTPGGWWANPALTGEINTPIGYTLNVTPLGNRYTLASVKFLFPFLNRFGAGIGIMGTGIAPDQSTQVTSSGLSYNSHFTFSNPSFQLGFGGNLPAVGSAGLLVDLGAEMLPDGFGGSSDFLVARCGLGVLTPYYFKVLSLSLTAMATMHFWDRMYMDENGKIGIRTKILDDLILGSAEYTFSFKSAAVESFYPSSQFFYEVFKATVSVQIYKVAGILAGYSTDFGQFSYYGSGNGNCLHAGIELRPQDAYPFFGGYDLGISTTFRDLFIHRIWIGYRFLKRQ
ncbi:MAG TPA: hypothetical protein VLX68_02055 [Chitinivibrionales bacterium]|nr:hypothetical protein [Chitinivibrionales bacterium]